MRHREPLRILTYNLQVGLRTSRYGDYVRGAWRHALPGPGLPSNLQEAARFIRDHDFVAIQEADAGSLRTRFTNQMEFLAREAEYPYHGLAVTRDLHPVARHCLGFLSRWPARIVEDHALPGPLPGRRALHVELALPGQTLSAFIVHLSLGRAAQARQIEHVAGIAALDRPTLILGDFNCEPQVLREHPALQRAGFALPAHRVATYPSWAPRRSLDHILVSPHLEIRNIEALGQAASDHLPVRGEIVLRTAS
ncbi:MAG TPA: endonuclease/exonuclease/phosphatase family protein [Nevskiaceae bacterium]|nr:endonuclease/exonuclease/phosphatase family protein [Nevskiaceae bacterium]